MNDHAIRTAAPRPHLIVGLDLGQASDHTALAVARQGRDASRLPTKRHDYAFGELHRYPLGTPYPAIVADLGTRLARYAALERGARLTLVLDGTGVGASRGGHD